ncbi:MAG: NAD(P)H-dependent oxidoreductase subunit E [Sphaerochaetaceae bacterium]|jgi:NADH:ubiquinone oxidoreductase subunit E|nr:NAD(P)H-dependent oxidoreductase subunit E [Sphaerochaetaceae bacterium]MDC7238508.1 NAD(P)H-dependent oxidoreductase subunit E [Sphaerochaetaceae bacterium]MDC7250673.1 NAD(P)H-dependent oxidoreductase subunit E [Sphaerochaetaceae bacterium]
MDKKVKIKICVGTSCFVQGGSDLLLYNDFIDPEIIEKCDIEGISCFNACKGHENGSAPFVMINDKIYGDMTPEKLNKIVIEVYHARNK